MDDRCYKVNMIVDKDLPDVMAAMMIQRLCDRCKARGEKVCEPVDSSSSDTHGADSGAGGVPLRSDGDGWVPIRW